MRKTIPLSVLTAVVLTAGCRKAAPRAAMNDDLRRDLQLATSADMGMSANVNISPDELGPQSKPKTSVKLTPKAGPRVMRTSHPHVRASRQPVEAAAVADNAPAVEEVAPASQTATTDATPSAPPMARPAPLPEPSPGPGTGASNGGGSGIGSILGGIAGILIQGTILNGGGADGDHCEPRGGGGRRGGVYGPGGVYGGGDVYGGGRRLPRSGGIIIRR